MLAGKSPEIRISSALQDSIVDGPGMRFVVFTQGCPHHCAGCHNPDTHDFKGGRTTTVDKLLAAIDQNPLTAGVTLSGGEPFAQAEALLPFAQAVKARDKHLVAYTGYRWEELWALSQTRPAIGQIAQLCDYIVDGRFELAQKSLLLPFRGSKNQRIIDVPDTLRTGEVVTCETMVLKQPAAV